jgi:two-component system, chemotaxis family, CheB/CheR fusion protein
LPNKKSSTNGSAGSAHASRRLPTTAPPAQAAAERPDDEKVRAVGVGASAGGLEALTELLRELPPLTGAAYVLVQHLAPTHESILAELLGRVTAFPVVQATDGLRLERDHAYVIPPDTVMLLADGHLRLAPRDKSTQLALPINAFFRSLAEVRGGASIGVVLSGTGSDGAAGLEAIKAAGGITFAQDAASARYDGMPTAAVATGCVDFVLPPREIAQRLVEIGKHPYVSQPEAPDFGTDDVAALATIFGVLRRHSHVAFGDYKEETVRRRLLRRMALRRIDSLSSYATLLNTDAAEVASLYADLLIGVTRFFRDGPVFAALFDKVFPEVVKRRPNGTPIRVWVPGCSTGEEAYSIAICLLESLGNDAPQTPIQVFATDLSERAIACARTGLYPLGIEEDVSLQRLEKFFVKTERGYRIARSVRDVCVFARQNVTDDPPISQLDLISCRNLLIYLKASCHAKVLEIFHYALKSSGILLLGNTESVSTAATLFSPLEKKHRIYSRTNVPSSLPYLDLATSAHLKTLAESTDKPATRAAAAPEVQRAADQVVLGYAPGGVVVDAQLRIVQFRGGTSAYLEPAVGAASFDLLRMARPELRGTLRGALRRASERAVAVRVEGASVERGGKIAHVTLRVIPFKTGTSDAQFFAVLFEDEVTPATSLKKTTQRRAGRARAGAVAVEHADNRLIGELKQELEGVRREQQAIAQEHESAITELQTANEEVQSSNEELQSTNEELETAKEELQSANQELTTLNDQIHGRNAELARFNDDWNNLIASMHVPIIMVGADLRVRRFTAGAEHLMKLAPTDVGRPIKDIKANWDTSDLEQVIARVLQTLDVEEREVCDDEGHWYGMAVRPYLTAEHNVDGAVIVYQDIDLRQRQANELDVALASADTANRAKSGFLATMSHELRTPLNAIGGYAALMADGLRGPVTAAQVADLARIRAAGRHLLGLINDILNYTKLESGNVLFADERVPLDATVAAAAEMIAPQALAKQITFEQHPCDRTSAVRGDREKVVQIVLNLLSNAVKFTAPGGRIHITCDPASDPARIQVRDTGRGMAADTITGAFEPFVQVGRTLTAQDTGAGLGLSISRELARGMGGDLTAESVLGQGSTFTVTLPRAASVPPGSVAPVADAHPKTLVNPEELDVEYEGSVRGNGTSTSGAIA